MKISGVLLVAKREMQQILKMKSFWLTLLILPLALAAGPIFADALDDDEPTQVAIVDRSGGSVKQAVEARFDFDETQYLLQELARYVQRYDLAAADPGAAWAQPGRWYDADDVASFTASGGAENALADIAKVRPEGVPEFEIPTRDYSFVEPLAELANLHGQAFEDAARAFLDTDTGEAAPEIIVLIPESYPDSTNIGVFAADRARGSFVETISEVLTIDLRTRLLAEAGVTGDRAALVQNIVPQIAIDTPPPGGGARERLLVQSIVPIALAYILMMGLMLSGSWMLQGSVEERSNKLLESLLACITPEELMYGKLLGSLSVGLMMIAVWVGCAGIAAYATQGAISDLIRPALEPLSSPGIIAAILFFFIAGYIGISAIFVAIGAMVDSMSEAQGYMMPVLFLILLPISFLLQLIIAGNDGVFVHVLTWVPLWTPFAVLARLGMGIEAWELIGSGIVLAVTIAIELVLIGRLFRQSLLGTGQKPTWASILRRLKGTSQT